MPTISTIKPDGSGDYTTLQAWEDWADGQASGAQWAECYSGGDLGYMLLENWTGTIDASNYPRIYAADGEGHEGDITAGAYSTGSSGTFFRIDEHYVEVDGIRFTGNARLFFRDHNNNVIRNCMIQGGSTYQGMLITNCLNTKIYNNVVVDAKYGIYCASANTNSSTEIYNNTVYNCTDSGITLNETVGTCTVTLKNNVVMGNGIDYDEITGTPIVTSDYNIISDGSLTSEGVKGSNDLENQTLSAVLTDAANDDFTIVEDGPAHNAGEDLSSTVTTDIIGVPRPQEGTMDIGAFEIPDYIWENSSGNWSDASNWGGRTVPTSTCDVTFNSDSNDCTVDGSYSCQSLTISDDYTGTLDCANDLTINNGSVVINGQQFVSVGGGLIIDGVEITATGIKGGGTITVTGA